MNDQDKLNILLVDDQPGKLLTYEVILKDLGENLIKASSGAEALEHLLRNEVAVILVDVCMPELDGFELAAMIRNHPRCAATAIIFISAVQLADDDRLRGYEMGAVDYVPVPVVPQVLRAKVRVFAELYRKTRQLEQLNAELEQRVTDRTAELESYASKLAESEHRRNLALAASEMGSWDWDLTNGDCMWDDGQYRIFGVEPASFKVTPERVKALVHPEDWERLQALIADSGSRALEAEFRIRRPDGETRWCLGNAAATLDESGRIQRISGVTMDITARKQAEERQTILAREVDHRARNVLAVVQSMLRLTKAETVSSYVTTVEGRINALSRAHMLLSESRWQGADLGRLVDEELAPYRRGERCEIEADGPKVLLEPKRAQGLALALHELATNAAKHGALSHPSGVISISWRSDSQNLVLAWRERGGPPVASPSSRGFGMRVINASIEQLGGDAAFDWRSEGLSCAMTVPLAASPVASEVVDIDTGKVERATILSLSNGCPRVLLVEDESLVAIMMIESLTELGFEVVGPWNNVADAINALDGAPVGAAILDINLGKELVYPVAEKLKEMDVPFAFVTGYGNAADPRYGSAPLLMKPIDRDALRSLFGMLEPIPANEPSQRVRAMS